MFNTLEELLSGTGQGPYTPPTNRYSFDPNNNPKDDRTKVEYFNTITRQPQGNYAQFDPEAVKAWQRLYKHNTGKDISVDGFSGDETYLAALRDQISRWDKGDKSEVKLPSYTPTEATPLSFDEYTGRNPLNDLLEQFKPKKEISEERMNKAAGFAALGALLRNVVDANYGSQGAQIVQHTDPEWAMKLSKRYEQLKDQRKADELRYNMLRLQDGMRGRDRYDAYRDRIDERNMNNRDFATRQKFEDENKQYWYDRQRADHLSDYSRSRADQLDMMDRQTAKQKELAKYNSNLQEGAWERRLKKMQELGVTSNGKPVGASGGSGKPFMTVSLNGRDVPMTDGQAMAVFNWALRNRGLSKDDLSIMKSALDGAGKTLEVKRIVQKAVGKYMEAQARWQQTDGGQAVQPTPLFPQQPARTSNTGYNQTTGAPPSAAIPNTIQLLMKRGKNYQEAQDAFGKMQANGIDDETAYNMLMQADD